MLGSRLGVWGMGFGVWGLGFGGRTTLGQKVVRRGIRKKIKVAGEDVRIRP